MQLEVSLQGIVLCALVILAVWVHTLSCFLEVQQSGGGSLRDSRTDRITVLDGLFRRGNAIVVSAYNAVPQEVGIRRGVGFALFCFLTSVCMGNPSCLGSHRVSTLTLMLSSNLECSDHSLSLHTWMFCFQWETAVTDLGLWMLGVVWAAHLLSVCFQ